MHDYTRTIRIWYAEIHEYVDTIEPLFGIDFSGLDFSLPGIDERSKKFLMTMKRTSHSDVLIWFCLV